MGATRETSKRYGRKTKRGHRVRVRFRPFLSRSLSYTNRNTVQERRTNPVSSVVRPVQRTILVESATTRFVNQHVVHKLNNILYGPGDMSKYDIVCPVVVLFASGGGFRRAVSRHNVGPFPESALSLPCTFYRYARARARPTNTV